MRKSVCACGKEMFQVVEKPSIWVCTNEKWTHVWAGTPDVLQIGLTSNEDIALGAALLKAKQALDEYSAYFAQS